MAIVCSSSKAGDSFKGAVNSTLFVDELEISSENNIINILSVPLRKNIYPRYKFEL